MTKKIYVDDSIEDSIINRFHQALLNFLRVSVGNDTYNLTKCNKIQITDVTEIKARNSGSDLLQEVKIINNNEKNEGKNGKIVKSTKTSSPTGYSGAESLPPIVNSFM